MELTHVPSFSEHGNSYTPDEYVQRLDVFVKNMDRIERHNAAGHT